MAKKVCKIVKEKLHKEDVKKYKKVVKDPKYFCKSCGHVAAKQSNLCKPEEI